MIRYGITLASASEDCSPAGFGELAALAERAGWDGVFLEDYIIHWEGDETPIFDPWITLAVMAVRTTRITLGITVTPLTRRRPWKVAREALTLDHLSNGRFVLGVGMGMDTAHDFTIFNEEPSASKLDEGLRILTGLLSGEHFSFEGHHYQVDEVRFAPHPVHRPHIPIWVGGGYPLPGPTERAIQYDGSCLYHVPERNMWVDMKPDDVRHLRDRVRFSRGDNAAVRYTIVVGGGARSDDVDLQRSQIRQLAEAGANWWMEHIEPDTYDVLHDKIVRGPLRA